MSSSEELDITPARATSSSDSDEELLDISKQRSPAVVPEGQRPSVRRESSSGEEEETESGSRDIDEVEDRRKRRESSGSSSSSSRSRSSGSEDELRRKAEEAAKMEAAMLKLKREEQSHRESVRKQQQLEAQQLSAMEIQKKSKRTSISPKDFLGDNSALSEAPRGSSSSGLLETVKSVGERPSELQFAMKDKRYREKVLGYSQRFTVGYAETRGRRATMEDKMALFGQFRPRWDYYAVFDGHGGESTAAYAAKHLHKMLADALDLSGAREPSGQFGRAFASCQKRIEKEAIDGGATALAAVITESEIYIANLGDCRAVLCKRGAPAVRASHDHKPHDPTEERRITEAGGFVSKVVDKDGTVRSRVVDMLAVSRSLGDNPLRKYLTHEPQIHGPYDYTEYDRLVLACDGVWDVLPDNVVSHLALEESCAERAARKIRDWVSDAGPDSVFY